jgi:hypothetical protein
MPLTVSLSAESGDLMLDDLGDSLRIKGLYGA